MFKLIGFGVTVLTFALLEQKREDLKRSLLAVSVGVKQKTLVNKMVEKVIIRACKSLCLFLAYISFHLSEFSSLFLLQFLSVGFVVMLFHYDGIVDEWKDFRWCEQVIHVAAFNQTKW